VPGVMWASVAEARLEQVLPFLPVLRGLIGRPSGSANANSQSSHWSPAARRSIAWLAFWSLSNGINGGGIGMNGSFRPSAPEIATIRRCAQDNDDRGACKQ
jgi:hypothetical protein